MSPAATILAMLLAQAPAPVAPAIDAAPIEPAAAPPTVAPSPTTSTAAPEPPEEPAPPPLPPPPEPTLYGDRGMSELSLALGYSSDGGFLAGGGYRRFVVAGVAPGLEASVQTGGPTTIGLVLGSLRVVPFRTRQVAFALTGRAGRVLLSDHDDGWGAGGGASAIISLAANVGLELGYDVLWLLPSSFCADLSACTIQGPVIGIRLSF
jgi:hypothetical protein